MSKVRVNSIVSQFRNYDRAVSNWLNDSPSNENGDSTPVVMATPDRAFGAMAQLMKINVGREHPAKNIPLPFISVTSNGIQFDPDRYHGPTEICLGKTSDSTQSYKVGHPLPYSINYRAEFWTRNMESMNNYKLWIAASFAQGYEFFLPVNLSNLWPYWDKKLVPIVNEGIQFSGDTDPMEDGNRIIRSIASFTLKGWIIPTIGQVKNIHKIIVQTYMAKTEADIQRVTADEVDDSPDIYVAEDIVTVE